MKPIRLPALAGWIRKARSPTQPFIEVDPLVCPKCSGQMRVIAFIEDEDVIRKILKHLDLWDVKRKPPPRAHGPPDAVISAYAEPSAPTVDDCIIDPDYPVEAYF